MLDFAPPAFAQRIVEEVLSFLEVFKGGRANSRIYYTAFLAKQSHSATVHIRSMNLHFPSSRLPHPNTLTPFSPQKRYFLHIHGFYVNVH